MLTELPWEILRIFYPELVHLLQQQLNLENTVFLQGKAKIYQEKIAGLERSLVITEKEIIKTSSASPRVQVPMWLKLASSAWHAFRDRLALQLPSIPLTYKNNDAVIS